MTDETLSWASKPDSFYMQDSLVVSDIEVVKARMKKPAIVSGIIMAIIIGMIIYQGTFISFIKRWEWVQAVLLFFIFGGVWYGRHIIANGGRAPVDEYTGERYCPGGFNGSLFRWLFSLAIGATIGTVMFFYDTVRVFIEWIRGMVNKTEQSIEGEE